MTGCKQTDVGVIPADWDVGGLGRFWSVTDCKHVTAAFVPDGFPVASIREVQSRFVDLRNAKRTTEHFYDLLIEGGRKPRPGDLILSRNATVGEVAQVTELHPPFAMGQDVCLLRKKSGDHSTEFLQALFESPVILNQLTNLMVGSTFKRANVEQIRGFAVPMPPPLEQRAIAAALSDVDALLAGLDRLIAKKRDIKQAAMQQLLTGQARLPGFQGEWEVKRFNDVLVRLNAKASQIQTTDYLTTGAFPVVDQGKVTVVGFSDKADKRFRCPDGGVIVFGDHTCIVKFISFDFLVGADGTQVLQSRDSQCTLFHAFQLQYRGIEPTGYNRHFKFLKEREFIVAPHLEQIAIATILSDMDAELAALEARRDKTRALKQGMMQELLTGRTRLV